MDYVEGTDATGLMRERFAVGCPRTRRACDRHRHRRRARLRPSDRNLVHRDVKPANILLSDFGSPRRRILLANFDIARKADDISGLTSSNMAVDSVAYAAPEQLMGDRIDGRADQYALAATAFHLLTGSQPFPNSNPVAVISKHLTAPPPRLSDHRPDLARFDPIISAALAKSPEQRYPRCLDFARALEGAAATPTVGAALIQPAIPTMNMPAPQRRSNRWVTVLVPAILALVLIGVLAFAVTQFFRAEPQRGTVASTAPPAAPRWQPYVDAAKKVAGDLTTLSAPTVDADIQRILDESTGSFYDDFAARRDDFAAITRTAGVTSTGTATGAGLESIDGETAQVLVAATQQTTNSAGTQAPRSMRFRIGVVKVGGAYTASKVEFVA